MNQQRLSRLLGTLRALFGIGVVLLLLWHVDLSMIAALTLAQVTVFILIVIALVLTTWFEGARLRALTQRAYTQADMLHTVFISYFVTNFTPSNFGGDGYKVYAIGKQQGYSGALAIVLLERVLGLLLMLGVALLFLVLLGGRWAGDFMALSSEVDFSRHSDTLRVVSMVLASAAVVALLLLRHSLARFISGFISALRQLTPAALGINLWYSLCLQLSRAALLCITLAAFGLDLNVAQAWLVTTAAALASLLPLSPGGLGIREAAMVITLAPFGVDTSTAILVSLVYRVASIAQAGIGALLFAKRRQADEVDAG